MYTRESHDPHWRDKRLYYAMVSPTGYNRNATVQHSDFAFIGGNAMASWGYTNGVCVCHDTRRRTHTVCVCMTHATALTRRSLWLWRARGAAAIVVPQIACTPPCVQSSFR